MVGTSDSPQDLLFIALSRMCVRSERVYTHRLVIPSVTPSQDFSASALLTCDLENSVLGDCLCTVGY